MTILLPTSGIIGDTLTGLINIAGSPFLALMMILMILIVVALALNIPMEAISVIMLPLIITMTAYTGDFLATAGCVLIYIGFILADKLFPRA
jgi:hypothetical protein